MNTGNKDRKILNNKNSKEKAGKIDKALVNSSKTSGTIHLT